MTTTIRTARAVVAALMAASALSACGQWTSTSGDPNAARLAAYECNRDNNPFEGRNASGGNIFTGIMGMNECMEAHGMVRK